MLSSTIDFLTHTNLPPLFPVPAFLILRPIFASPTSLTEFDYLNDSHRNGGEIFHLFLKKKKKKKNTGDSQFITKKCAKTQKAEALIRSPAHFDIHECYKVIDTETHLTKVRNFYFILLHVQKSSKRGIELAVREYLFAFLWLFFE